MGYFLSSDEMLDIVIYMRDFLEGGKTVLYYCEIMSESDLQNICWGSQRKTSYPTRSV
jgi:hypothetical protein